MNGRYLSSHRAVCHRCGNEWAHVYVVSDRPIIEEERCADCATVLSVNGTKVPAMEVATMAADGEGRR